MTMKLTLSSAHRCDTRELKAIRDRLDGLALRVDSPLKQLTTHALHRIVPTEACVSARPSSNSILRNSLFVLIT